MTNTVRTSGLLLHLILGTTLSILVFFSTSFITYLLDVDTFNPAASNQLNVDIGFPFTYYEEVGREDSLVPMTSAAKHLLLLDCAITWLFVALPYTLIKTKKNTQRKAGIETGVLDENLNEL